jgi:hypothetical protein
MRCAGVLGSIGGLFLATACGGSQQHAALEPTASDTAKAAPDTSAPSDAESADDTKAAGDSKAADDAAKATKKSANDSPTPSFKENGSVLEAINAVPQGTPRLNIEQEELGRPLNNPDLYEPCKPGSAHFKAKVAIWDGKAVGLDLTTTPKNGKLAACVSEKIRSITWPDKVKALNIVEYTF